MCGSSSRIEMPISKFEAKYLGGPLSVSRNWLDSMMHDNMLGHVDGSWIIFEDGDCLHECISCITDKAAHDRRLREREERKARELAERINAQVETIKVEALDVPVLTESPELVRA